jgi:hypothetical protein
VSDSVTRIRELRQSAIQASLNYDVWWVFKNPDTRPKYAETMNRYSLYFQAAINAHFIGFLLPLYRLFESRPDTHNIPRLIRQLRAEDNVLGSKLDEFDKRLVELKPVWKKIATLRNEVFGHRTIELDISSVFLKASITADEIRVFIEHVLDLVNGISAECEDSYEIFNLGACDEAETVLRHLKEYHAQRVAAAFSRDD